MLDWTLGAGYQAAGICMVVTIYLMIVLDAVHPPAVATALSFAFRSNDAGTLALLALAVAVVAIVVFLHRAVLYVLSWLTAGQ